MVGASIRSVTPSSTMVASAASPVNAGRMMCVPPLTIRQYKAEKSARWNIGMACMNTELGPKKPRVIAASPANARLSWLIITPLGKPVVPPV
ncbi:hypothetical protein D3C81_1330550 [compost metagenome]